jgi:hypothetical protein
MAQFFSFQVAIRRRSASILMRTENLISQERSMQSTPELAIEAQSENRASFAELIRRYRRVVLSSAWSVLHDYHSAQDVAPDCFLIAI